MDEGSTPSRSTINLNIYNMDPKFKVGDVVTIKRDLERASNADIPFGICDSMENTQVNKL